jgi:hypothetical protein
MLLTCLALTSGLKPASGQSRSDEELKAHLDSLERKVNDRQISIENREQLALEMAATIDRSAQTATSADLRYERWREASAVLDRFNKNNPAHPLERQFDVQSAIYLWAIARTQMNELRTNPRDAAARAKAVSNLEAAARRLKPVVAGLDPKNVELFPQNARYRLAQTLADLAEIDSSDEDRKTARNREALDCLGPPITEPSIKGFANLLRSTLMTRLDRLDDAQAQLDEALKANPPLAAADILEARLSLLIAKREFDDVEKAIDEAKIDQAQKPLLKIRALIAERNSTSNRSERSAAEKELFRELKTARDKNLAEARAALIAAADAIQDPGEGQQPYAWDLIAQGAQALGDAARAGRTELKAADQAVAARLPKLASEYRLKAGAYFYQAEKYSEADVILTPLAEDAAARETAPKAGLLRALARGRALAKEGQGASPQRYIDALKYQIKTFPEDASTNEARWLLGKLVLASSERSEAENLWEAIPPGSTRWLESRLELAALHRSDLDVQRLNNDREAMRTKLDNARSFLARSIAEAKENHAIHQLQVELARIELTPGRGRVDQAVRLLEQVQRASTNAATRDVARRLYIVALAQSNRFLEAEQAARAEIKASEPVSLMEAIRLLDRSAAETESDLRMRRIGQVDRVLLGAFVGRNQALSPEFLSELQLRNVRALLFSGDEEGARRMINAWTEPPPTSTESLLRDLGELDAKLGLFNLAEDVQRLRAKRAITGSLPWFDARYGLALAYFRSGRSKEALHLIDATAILHPELGGGELREKFIRLRQRIDTSE